jgi:1,4-dihydroxy-2-naphthoate octaprenyltransferase
MLAKLIAFVRLSRPFFLLGGIVLYALGAFIARYEGTPMDWRRYVLGQLVVTGLQLMTHYLNEYWDVEADRLNRARTFFSGGSGVLSNRALSRETALAAALISLAVSGVVAFLLAAQYRPSPVVWIIMGAAFLGAFFYSTPPVALAGTGFGELTASLVVAGLVPAFAQAMQTGRVSQLNLVTTAPLVAMCYAMLLAFEMPDFLSDEAAGKRTLLVRLGRRRGMTLHNSVLLLGVGLVMWGLLFGLPSRVAYWLIVAAPLAAWQFISVRRLQQGEPVSFPVLTFGAVALFGLAAYLLALGYWNIG